VVVSVVMADEQSKFSTVGANAGGSGSGLVQKKRIVFF
jgi:hypothetical protein